MLRPRDLGGGAAALGEEKIAHNERKGALRFSVHLHNDEKDADHLIRTLAPFF